MSVRQLVTNGDFGSADGWTAETGWTINTGANRAEWDNATDGNLYRDIGAIEGYTYRVTYTLEATEFLSKCTVSIGGAAGTLREDDATYTEDIIAGSSNSNINFLGRGVASLENFRIRNVSVFAVLSDEAGVSARLFSARGL